jgi:hypothetical protein
MKDYNTIMNTNIKHQSMLTKNNQVVRNLFAELTAICVLSKKSNLFLDRSLPKMSYKSYQKEDIHKRMISNNFDKIIEFVHTNTNNEIKIGLNEIIHNLESKKGTYQNCIYWYLWIEKLSYYHKKDNVQEISKISPTSYKKNEVEKDHWVNIIWDIVSHSKVEKKDKKYIEKLHLLYNKDLKKTQITKKKYHIFIAFYIIKNSIKWNKRLFYQEHIMIQSNININKIYRIIICHFEKSLTEETKRKIRKNYMRMINEEYTIKKVENIDINNDINKILSTKYPEYIDFVPQENDVNSNIKENENEYDNKEDQKENTLISKNMNMQDIINSKEQLINKKIDAFKNFFTFKNKNTPTVFDYYKKETNEQEEETIRNIILLKRK